MKMNILFTIGALSYATAEKSITQHCNVWPHGWPKEHHDASCNRALQNSILKEEVANRNPLPIRSYLNLPEEKTWVCPLEDESDSVNSGEVVIGRATRWILYNQASTPIIVERVNESSLMDSVDENQLKSAVYPNGPVVLPGDMAIVNGYEGQLFTAREYKEDISLLSLDNQYSNSFRDALPHTWSFGRDATQYFNNKNGIRHVLGSPGRVLMKHRMGMIHIKNDHGALCPESFGGMSDSVNTNRASLPISLDPDCNFLEKGMVNKVGCPIDIYFSPAKIDPNSSFDCETHLVHMDSLESFLASGQTAVNSYGSPVVYQRTFNTHSFTVRTSHDDSLVTRIEIEADRVYDCPELKRSIAQLEVKASGMLVQSQADSVALNTTAIGYGSSSAIGGAFVSIMDHFANVTVNHGSIYQES